MRKDSNSDIKVMNFSRVDTRSSGLSKTCMSSLQQTNLVQQRLRDLSYRILAIRNGASYGLSRSRSNLMWPNEISASMVRLGVDIAERHQPPSSWSSASMSAFIRRNTAS
jgi:hypothetical protein